jgi:hypothetical protein
MALGTGKGLTSAAMRARVALVIELPLATGVADAPLAFALAARRDLARDWIGDPSTGSLASRRLAARLIERAAREASRRASQGDDHALRVFKGDTMTPAWDRLFADRESLVWRHVAVARGLLAPWAPALAHAVEEAFDASLSPTEWRRAAASVAALVAVAPERALDLAQRVLGQGLLDRDPGSASAFLWGLARAAEAEPEAATELLDAVLDRAGPDVAEAVLDLRAELGDAPLVQRAAARALEVLSKRPKGTGGSGGDDGAEALALEVARDLEGASRADEPVRDQIAAALAGLATAGARGAHARAKETLAAAQGSLDALEAVSTEEDGEEGRGGSMARRASLAVLRDMDVSLLEHDLLGNLLSLGTEREAARAAEVLDGLRDRLAGWILAREQKPLTAGPGGAVRIAHPTLSHRRLRALLHLADSDMGDDEVDPARAARLRQRWLRIARALLDRFEHGPASPVRRTIVAALARALDALVRVGACDVIDALLVAVRHIADPVALGTLAEASMHPDLVHVLSRYTRFAQAVAADVDDALPAFDELARDLVLDTSSRSEALRTVLVRLGGALGKLDAAVSLRELAPDGTEPEAVTSLEGALGALAQLAVGARGRLDPERAPVAPPVGLRPLTIAVARVLSGADPFLGEHIVAAALDHLLAGIPKGVARLVAASVWRMVELPKEGSKPPSHKSVRVIEALPTWLPARRTIGGFYVVRALSAGALGSVFVATRVEDKGDPEAERFALKVPEFSATAARSLSEAEFMKLFREEASALMAVPQHPNLARFVTFDAGSKPKPILVMELVEGTTLERLLEARNVDVPRALRMLDDVLRGLEAMHAVGVGHLDVKPSNVVLRRGEEAVLVDFGLAGRHIRPGCATGPYGAPEVWGALDGRAAPPPAKTDVYAFGCLAFEALTGRVLFDADSELAQITMHVSHDGSPPPLRLLAQRPALRPIGELLVSTLRRDPDARPSASAVRKELARVGPALASASWPIDVEPTRG